MMKFFMSLVCLRVVIALQSHENCGIQDQTVGLIIGGEKIKPNEYPWSVALFYKGNGTKYNFICGATLIATNKVITASHCLQSKYSSIIKKAEDIELRMGSYDLSKAGEVGSLTIKPSSITLHPEWNSAITSYDADIAVLELPQDVPITKFIRPICIWERRRGYPNFLEGVVVGWGLSAHDKHVHENIARHLYVPVITNEKCFLDEPEFAQMSSNRTFCGGARNGQGPCKGDSGSGMFFLHDGKFYIGGIVSASTFDTLQNCDVTNYAVYTDFFKFTPWLSGKKFNEKSQSQLACESFKGKRPQKPINFQNAELPSNEADIGEFPHMVLIGYENLFTYESNEIHFGCNGALLSEKFVISTVHCVSHHHSVRKPAIVRFGAIKKDFKINGKQIAADVPIKVFELKTLFLKIDNNSIILQNIIMHEDYAAATWQNDISLIELERPAPLSYFVWPACLFNEFDSTRRLWIATSPWSNVSRHRPEPYYQKFPVQEISMEECKTAYKSQGIDITSNFLCAKYVINNVITYYYGRGGAPIQILQGDSFYIGGINFFGIVSKDKFSVKYPDVYIRIASYIDWIEEQVWKDDEADNGPENYIVSDRVIGQSIREPGVISFPED